MVFRSSGKPYSAMIASAGDRFHLLKLTRWINENHNFRRSIIRRPFRFCKCSGNDGKEFRPRACSGRTAPCVLGPGRASETGMPHTGFLHVRLLGSGPAPQPECRAFGLLGTYRINRRGATLLIEHARNGLLVAGQESGVTSNFAGEFSNPPRP